MRKNLRTIAGMAICALGVLATSSCSKDEFFGLEDSVYIDNSLKTEIAMSKEFADYAIACFNLVEEMNNPIDTANMQIQGVVDGNPIYYTTGSHESILEMMDNLKKAYPELTEADKLDFDELMEIALSKNKVLKAALPRRVTKAYIPKWGVDKYSYIWIYSASGGAQNYELQAGDWWFKAHDSQLSAVSHVIWTTGEANYIFPNGGGIIFPDNSAVSMVGSGETWPSITDSYSGPTSEADFVVIRDINLYSFEIYDYCMNLGPYYCSVRYHYVYNEEMQYIGFYF